MSSQKEVETQRERERGRERGGRERERERAEEGENASRAPQLALKIKKVMEILKMPNERHGLGKLEDLELGLSARRMRPSESRITPSFGNQDGMSDVPLVEGQPDQVPKLADYTIDIVVEGIKAKKAAEAYPSQQPQEPAVSSSEIVEEQETQYEPVKPINSNEEKVEATPAKEEKKPDPRRRQFRLANLVAIFYILGCVVCFIYGMYVNNCMGHNREAQELQDEIGSKGFPANDSETCFVPQLGRFAFQNLEDNDLVGPSFETLDRMGAMQGHAVRNKHEFSRLLKSFVLSQGLVQLVGNSISIHTGMVLLAKHHDVWFLCVTYVLSYLGSALTVLYFGDQKLFFVGMTGGTSGLTAVKIFGVLKDWWEGKERDDKVLTWVEIIYDIVSIAYISSQAGESAALAVGGFLTGTLLCVVHSWPRNWPGVTALIVLILGFALGLGLLYF